MKTAAIAIVRNAADLAPLTAVHHHLLGADSVWVVDNGSSDGTYENLRGLAARVPGLRIDRDDGPFDQARMATDMANRRRAWMCARRGVKRSGSDEAPGPARDQVHHITRFG